MDRGIFIHCLSNASVDVYYNNKLSNYTNVLPRNFDLSHGGEDRAWEIGVVAFGIDLNIAEAEGAYYEVVKIASNIISAEPNEEEPVLYTSYLPSDKRNKYYFKTVKTVRYFPVRNTNLKTVSIKFLKTDDTILKLQDGQPSIVQFHLRKVDSKMPYNTIHLQVDNRLDEGTHPQNRLDNFYVNLKTPIYLNRGAKIALTDISYPNNIRKIPDSIYEEEHEIRVVTSRSSTDFKFSTDLDATQLINQMNEQRDIYTKNVLSYDLLKKSSNLFHFQVKYVPEANDSYRLRIFFPGALKRLLGVEETTDIILDKNEHKTFTAGKPITNLSSLNRLEAVDRRVNILMTVIYGKFNINRLSTINLDSFAVSLNKTLGENLKKIIHFQVSDRHLVIKRICEQERSIIVTLQPETKTLLGISLNRDIELPRQGAKFFGDKPINLHALYPGVMMCYTNFIKHSMIGSDFYPLFRTIPVADISNQDDEYISVHFDNLEFHRINTSRLDLLHFQFKKINGDFVKFEDSSQKMIVNLSIRNPK